MNECVNEYVNECMNEMLCAERSRDWRQRLWRGGTGRKRKHGWPPKQLLLQNGGACSPHMPPG